MELEEEKKVIEKAQKDPKVFGELYEKYYSQVFGHILKRTKNLEVAQDITGETFFKALKNLSRFHWRNISISIWLYRIANNEIANYYRKNKYPVSLEILNQEEGFGPIALHNPEQEFIEARGELERHQDFLEIQGKIAKLSIKYQEVITLRFFEKKEIREISEILGKKEGTIKSLLHRGLEKLRKML